MCLYELPAEFNSKPEPWRNTTTVALSNGNPPRHSASWGPTCLSLIPRPHGRNRKNPADRASGPPTAIRDSRTRIPASQPFLHLETQLPRLRISACVPRRRCSVTTTDLKNLYRQCPSLPRRSTNPDLRPPFSPISALKNRSNRAQNPTRPLPSNKAFNPIFVMSWGWIPK